MDKWHNQFEKLKRQWSEFNQIASDYKPHDKRQVAKLGVAWVIKLPGEYFKKPVGWEVEIIDTPIGISERSNKLLKWLRHPPTSVYDNISLFDDSSDILLDDSFENRQNINYKRKFERSLSLDETQQKFQVPPNEYEIFKKTCCECREKSFKNTSTDYDSDVKASSLKREDVPYRLQAKTSYFDLPPTNTKISGKNQEVGSIANHSLYSDFEQELNNEILDDRIISSFDRTEEPKYSKKNSTPKNYRRNFSKTNHSIETSRVLSDMDPYDKQPSRDGYQTSLNNKRANGRGSPIHNHENNHTKVRGNSVNEAVIPYITQGRNTGPHIPSVDAFDDNILTRGTSLEQYRNTDHVFHPSKDDDLIYRGQRSNGHRSHRHHHHHRHHHRTNGSKDVSIDTVPNNNILPEYEPKELREEFDEKEESII